MTRGLLSEQFEDTVYDYRVISGQSIVEVSGAVKFHSVILNRAQSGVVTIFDSAVSGRYLSAGSIVIGLPQAGNLTSPVEIDYDIRLRSGLVVVVSGTVNVVVLYK